MAGGIAVVLGVIGANFGAGMTGGMAFVYDADDSFARKANPDSIVWQRLASAHWDTILRRSEEHTSELQSIMRISYAVFCLKKKTQHETQQTCTNQIHEEPDIKT